MRNLNKLYVVLCTTALVACAAETNTDDIAFDFTTMPELSDSPSFASSAANTGDAINVNVPVKNNTDYITFQLQASGTVGIVGSSRVNDVNNAIAQVNLITDCSVDSATYYPYIDMYDQATGQTIYYYDPSSSTTHFVVDKVSNKGDQKKEVSDIAIASIDLNQPGGDGSKADLSITITDVSKVGAELQISYTIFNNGTRGASGYSTASWGDRASPPTDSTGAEGSAYSPIAQCVPVSGSKNGKHFFTSDLSSGNAYMMVDTQNNVDELDETNNVSSVFSW